MRAMRAVRYIFAAMLLFTLNDCGGGSDTTTPLSPPPLISSFSAAVSSIPSGTSTTLTAFFSNGSGSIDQGIGSLQSGVPISTGNLTATRTYTLTVTGSGAPATAQVTVTVNAPPPAIQSFTATPSTITSGQISSLVGVYTNGSGVITPGNIAIPSGVGLAVSPAETTTYTLTVSGSGIPAIAETMVTVQPLSITVSISPNGATLLIGGTQQFTATVTNSVNQAVNWTVQEGTAGGTVSSSGLYTAPVTAGAFHVVATCQADTSKIARVVVTVSAPPIPLIIGLRTVGQPILIFDHLVDKQESSHLPDLALTAWKEANGTVNMTVPHFENYRMRGPDLEHLTSDPNKVFSSTVSASDIVESRYNCHHWLAAPYTFDGLTIYALAHSEWYACLLNGDCSTSTTPSPISTGSYQLNSWANTVTSFKSVNGGASWAANGVDAAHIVSNESFTWTGSSALASGVYRQATNHTGLMAPSRVIKEGNYYYSIGFLNHRDFTRIDPVTGQAPIDKYGYVLMRTTDLTRPSGWEGWVSGSQYTPMAGHGFSAFSPRKNGADLNAASPQIIFDTKAQSYIAIFTLFGDPGPIYYMTTPSLANPSWSEAIPIGGTAATQVDPRSPIVNAACNTGFQDRNYVSLMDTHSAGLNFEFTDGDPWLFYIVNPVGCGGSNEARDIYRLRLVIDYR